MDKETTENQGRDKVLKRRVAYTLNNYQPVQCTIISDQPLFYMDMEGDFEEEADLDSAVFGHALLEEGLAELTSQPLADGIMSAAERPDRLSRFRAEAVLIGTSAALTRNKDVEAQSFEDLKALLGRTRTAVELMQCAETYNVALRYSRQTESAVYDRNAGLILINPDMALDHQVLLAVRELRRHWQHRAGALIHPLSFQPDQAVLVNRVQLADLVTFMVRAAWELQLADYRDAWVRVEASSLEDLARAFSREAHLDFRTLNNGVACAAVFEAWFMSERCRRYDRLLIQQMLADYKGYVFDSQYASQHVTVELISAIGTMPFGKNYLASYAHMIMNDPVFTDVRDRSNANFLWFIKFERSFRDSERDLQTPSAQNGVTEGTSHAEQQTADIVRLDPVARKDGAPLRGRGDAINDGNVVELSRWSGRQSGN